MKPKKFEKVVEYVEGHDRISEMFFIMASSMLIGYLFPVEAIFIMFLVLALLWFGVWKSSRKVYWREIK